jgi:hypothetical protein
MEVAPGGAEKNRILAWKIKIKGGQNGKVNVVS